MKKLYRRILTMSCMLLLLIALLGLETYTFAWLTTSWNGGDFSMTAAYTNTPLFELWTYHETADGDNPKGWYKTYADSTSEQNVNIPKIKQITDILTKKSNGKYEKTSKFSLYFGTINNLVEEQENLPIYLKFTVKLPARSLNQVTLKYILPDNYVKAYYAPGNEATLITDTTANENLITKLNNKTLMKFIEVSYFYDPDYAVESTPPHNVNYSLTDGASDLPVSFVKLFTTASSNLHHITDDTNNIELSMSNAKFSEQEVYVYFKFSVPTSALQTALLNTKMKDYMPIYLVFDTEFGVDVMSISM